MTMEKKDVNSRIARWALALSSYDYVLEHRPGVRMQHVDALSRAHPVLVVEGNSFERNLALVQDKDPLIVGIREELEASESKQFELRNGLVYRKIHGRSLFYVPASMEQQVIRASHDDLGHGGVDKTVEFLSRIYWFPNAKEKIKVYIGNCLKCIAFSVNMGKKEGELHSIPKGREPFQVIHADHFGPLEATVSKNRYILEIRDGFTRFVKFYATKTTNASEIIKNLKTYFSNYSSPKNCLITDRGSGFRSAELKEFLDGLGIRHIMVATASPWGNGEIERVNRDLGPMLAKLCESPRTWDKHLGEVEFAMNNSQCRSIKTTPANLLFGVEQKFYGNDNVRNMLAEFEARDLNFIRDRAAERQEVAARKNEAQYNLKHKPPTKYKINDYVMIKNVDVTPGVNKKLLPKFRGPYVVSKILPNDRYVINDVEGFQVTQTPYCGVCSPQNMKPWLNV
ncbi:unnamed protein product [Nesidiocoris tenuis]|uniref:RNA-directed DNA polymerase n=1 Tax=Nesidiocoris tenuis TaxID=355587 RepID=A0A6H5HEQ4_9HEMI|nr:unnamed protein product [Nesidiocoris tenuis]